MPQGKKDDQGKTQWSLLPWEEVEEVVKVLMHGAKEYGDWNWKELDDPAERYFSAAQRHILSWWEGEKIDKKSGLPHLAHAACCLLFLLWHDKAKV